MSIHLDLFSVFHCYDIIGGSISAVRDRDTAALHITKNPSGRISYAKMQQSLTGM